MVLAVGQTNLFDVGQKLNSNILFPGDPDWFPTLEQWAKSPVISYDTETMRADGEASTKTDKTPLNPWKNAPRLLQVGVQFPDETVKVLMVDTLEHPDYKESQFFAILKHFSMSPERWIMMHNAMFDCLCWRVWWGWRVRNVFDTFVASNVHWAGLPVRHGLGALCERLFIEHDKEQQLSDWSDPILSPAQINYAARDVEVLFPIAKKLLRYVESTGNTQTLWDEIAFTPALIEMEFNGLPIDLDLLSKYQDEYQKAYDYYYKEINETWKQLGRKYETLGVVTERLDFSVDSKTEVPQFLEDLTGKKHDKADKQVLLQLAGEYPILGKLSLCRTLKKSIDKFKAIKEGARKHPTGQLVISGAYKQFTRSDENDEDTKDDELGAGTGRTGSGSGSRGAYQAPNLQNIPTYDKLPDEIKALGLKSIRECFRVTINPEGMFYIHDLAAAHARIAAKLSGDKLMHEIYSDDLDAHAITVTKLIRFLEDYDPATMQVTVEDVKKAKKSDPATRTPLQQLLINLRNVGKNFYYSNINDGSAFVLYRLFQSSYLNISRENSGAALTEFQALFAGLTAYMDDIKKECAIPPIDFPQDLQTLANRSARSKWFKFEKHWFYAVHPEVNGQKGRRTFRKVIRKNMKKGGTVFIGPKPADVFSATWLGIEATVMKRAAARLYRWVLDNPDIPFFVGGITHDELDSWGLGSYPEAAQALIESMDGEMYQVTQPIPAGPDTKPEEVIVNSWNDK
jgi:DNA polymerase I-like protein with 3'-5' exonuclease and polymerase domains